MRLPRYTTLQLLLAATLVALVLGLTTSSWRASKNQSIEQVCFSPNGEHLAARYSGGGVVVWRLDKSDPKLIARAFGQPGLLNFNRDSIHFVADDKLLNVETQWTSGSFGTHVRQLDLKTRQVTDQVLIDSKFVMAFAHAASAERLILSDGYGNALSSYSSTTGRLEKSWSLPGPPVWQMAISARGTKVAVCDQSRQVYLIDVESDRAPVPIQGGEPLAVSGDGRIVATTSMNKAGSVLLHDTPGSQAPVDLDFKLMTVKSLVITPDNSRLLVTDGTHVESHDLTKQQRPPRVELDPRWLRSIDSCVLSPAGNRLANHNATEIVVYELPGGNARFISAGGPPILEIVIFTLGFALWSATWGIVSKRERVKTLALATSLPPALTPRTHRPVPALVPWKGQFVWVIAMIGCSFAMAAVLDIGAFSSLATGLGQMVTTLATMVGGMILLVVVMAWIGYFIKGPHQWSLARLRRLAGESGRLRRLGRLTFWFVGNSRLETDVEKHLDNTLNRAEDLFGRCVEPKQLRLYACLDRQCDVDAFFGRHIPVAAIVPRYLIDRLAIVCEETAVTQLMPPQQALRSALAFSIVIEQKRGFLPGWVGTLLSQQIARERRPAEVRAAIRRLNVLFVREPNWDPRQVFMRSARERLKLWMAHDERQSWVEIHAETDLLLTLGEMLLGPDALPDSRQKVLAWLRAITPKDDPLSTFTRDIGLTIDALLDQWRHWLATQSGLPYDPMPVDSQWLLRDVALPTLANRQLPIKLRQEMVRQLGVFYVAAAPALMELLGDPKLELRREAAEALERLSGETWGHDLARWQVWWQSLPLVVRRDSAGDALGRMVSAAVVGESTEAAVTACLPLSSAPPPMPQELKLCWKLMLAGGLLALFIPIALLFAIGPVYYPMVYFSLFAGVAGTVRGAARDTIDLSRVAGLQMMNVMVCDPVNLIAGWIEHRLLRRPHVQQYLLAVNGGRL